MISCVKKSAFAAGIPVVMGIFTSGIGQAAATAQGLVKLNEIYYQRYEDDERRLIFLDPGSGNHGTAVMAVKMADDEFKDAESESGEEEEEEEEGTETL